MPIDDQAKNSLVINVSNLVRHSHVKVDVQRLSLAFRMSIDTLEPGEPVELEPLFQYMVSDLAIPEKEALELCIVIASRKDKLGFPFSLPLKAQNLSNDAVERVLEVHNEKRAVTGSWDVKKPEPEKAPAKKTERGWEPEKKKKKPSGPSRQALLGGSLAVAVVAAIAFNGWMSATAGPPIEEVATPVDGLPCVKLIVSNATAICTLPSAVFNGMAEETTGAKATLTKAALKAKGVKTIWVKLVENNKVVFVQ